jgi:hypothetical protein
VKSDRKQIFLQKNEGCTETKIRSRFCGGCPEVRIQICKICYFLALPDWYRQGNSHDGYDMYHTNQIVRIQNGFEKNILLEIDRSLYEEKETGRIRYLSTFKGGVL